MPQWQLRVPVGLNSRTCKYSTMTRRMEDTHTEVKKALCDFVAEIDLLANGQAHDAPQERDLGARIELVVDIAGSHEHEAAGLDAEAVARKRRTRDETVSAS